MLGRELWGAYLDVVMQGEARLAVVENVGPMLVAELLWAFPPKIEALAGSEAAKAIPLEDALWLAARTGTIDVWQDVARSTVTEIVDLTHCAIVAMVLESTANDFIVPLPKNASDEIRGTAALLLSLGIVQADTALKKRLQAARKGFSDPNRRRAR